MWRTRVGYAGGDEPSPTYKVIGDHTECFQIDFDPTVLSYEHLLELFWQSHDATRMPWKIQYASLILAGDDAQLAAARESAARTAELFGRRVHTRIKPLAKFWLAEKYHQKYFLRNDHMLYSEMRDFYPDDDAFVNSTTAARVNGLLAAATCERFERLLPDLGLSENAAAHLGARCR